MSEPIQTYEQTLNAFYPGAEAESLEAPTEEAASDETPEEVEELEIEESVEGEAEETEEAESSEEETEESEDAQTFEIEGEEHNLEDVNEWKQAHDNIKLMQADCTKKWQEASELKKDAEAQAQKANDLTLELEALIAEDSEVDLEDLKEYDEVEYYKQKEKIEKRKAKLKELKANQPQQQAALTQEQIVAESNDFYAYDPKWQKDGQLTEAFQKDMKLAGKYLQDAGYSQEETNAISYSHHWKTIIDASKYRAQQSKAKAIKKKIIKTPKAAKPKATKQTKSAADVFYGSK